MLPYNLLTLLLPLLSLSSSSGANAAPAHGERYDEQLSIIPLPDGKVHSDFVFTFHSPPPATSFLSQNAFASHHTLLPSVLETLVETYRVSTFSLTLSSGRWAPTWPNRARSTPASGIEVVAWLELLEGETEAEERKRWEDFTGALGGMFCAGVVNAKSTGESQPLWAYQFDGEGNPEATCTESLAPFIALLPCSSHAGLGSLLNPHTLFDGDWTLIGVHFGREKEGGKFTLQVGSVADPVRKERLRGGLGKRDFSMTSLYDRQLRLSCPVASSSSISLAIPVDSVSRFDISQGDLMVHQKTDGIEFGVWDASNLPDGGLDVSVTWPHESKLVYPHPSTLPLPPLTARRLLTGTGQERGKIGVELSNNSGEEVEVVWVEVWPWWVRGFISTLDATSSSSSASPKILSLSYEPPLARSRPTTLQTLLLLPPHSKSRLMVDYESSYLWYTEYPSDASRGFEVPGAVLVLLEKDGGSNSTTPVPVQERKHKLKVHTTSTLLSLPTPDFSMPYNVIILTSTVIALFFGSVMNPLVRKWEVVSLEG
ncbi:phosphatidylinositol glycan, class T [Pseudohyphozyma bogoriensis]|nr:phosphatidylinositol glycan, class T [Pseudohyphozyma bogoriensis]